VNKDYISKNLCENKDKPMLHCNGKCHLRKQLAKEDKKENTPFSQNMKVKFEVQFITENTISVVSSSQKTNELSCDYSFFIPSSPSSFIFHPPQV
jgi:hypothetical protein